LDDGIGHTGSFAALGKVGERTSPQHSRSNSTSWTSHGQCLTYQRWEGERIAEETFFFDPAQRVPTEKKHDDAVL
jgi:hypothetical protein